MWNVNAKWEAQCHSNDDVGHTQTVPVLGFVGVDYCYKTIHCDADHHPDTGNDEEEEKWKTNITMKLNIM